MKKEILEDNVELVAKLMNAPLLHSFGQRDMKQLLSLSETKKYAAGEMIIEEGSFDKCIYFLISGNVSIMKKGEEIETLRRTGDIFGEMCVVDGKPRSASIQAIDDVACMVMNVGFMDSLYSEDKIAFCSIFYQMIAEVLAYRLRETSSELVKAREELENLKNK
jgi:CRP-like cAMP-binding protein